MFTRIVSVISVVLLFFSNLFHTPVETVAVEQGVKECDKVDTDSTVFDRIDGVDCSVFYIGRPNKNNLKIKEAADFGLSAASYDNFTAMKNALDYCRANPGTELTFDEGTYYFRTNAALDLSHINGLLINGNGATFVFQYEGSCFYIAKADCVEFRNLKIDWDWDSKPLADTVIVVNADEKKNTLDFVFDNETVSADMNIMAITQCDRETLTFGEKNSSKENYVYQNPDVIIGTEKIDSNTLRVHHNGAFDKFKNGEKYIVRHYVYNGNVFHITGDSENISFDTVNIYGHSGMAYVFDGNCSHFQIINSFIGVNPNYADTRHVSVAADAIHIVNTNGCFNVADCDISAMGDDAINVHDGLGYINSVDGNRINMTASAMRLGVGDVIGFKNSKFYDTDFTAKIVSYRLISSTTWEVVFDTDLSEKISQGCIAYNLNCNSGNYVIRNNYFHENRARGLLLQSSDGLCENNRFYKIMGPAIRIIMDVQPALWQEGTGVNNLTVRNNIFDTCNYSNWSCVIESGGNLDGKSIENYSFCNINITGNEFRELSTYMMNLDSINGFEFSGNTVTVGNTFKGNKNRGKIKLGKNCANFNFKNNRYTDTKFFSTTEIISSKNLRVWAVANSQIK